MRRERELGYCLVTSKTGGSWHLQRDQYRRVRAAYDKGALRIDALDFHGAPGEIDLRNVDSVWDMTPEAVQSALAEAKADEQDDSLNTR